ncbi:MULTISPECIES: 2Fe-2S iron-sulfur cluster-binding protein [unclassified Neisseria]|uniref:2Fe-2S iron-sulfur cluster-binding protein n=1 Tax=unclassified Neisseria TaxID=2623750 RepID=UPI002666B7CE|nr:MULTISPECIES: 2Fe-2S iron-sulfur cluster-binding protein [unclassified Neisseria]MDO1509315.1 2Fe-2S iron-sulfur cluster-binding protein [Neisseria sp. MVDL19-042950]MDO1515406.1 2Fe-2S iron-sulfur cluster-binding protein [Neisseria sp. MVDL18-041461]MDO1562766.1 2Fe-2S iron-sulfur cluster-binding protein [Neisseria sp. MVDL20-010259]
MSYIVTLVPDHATFSVEAGEPILNAAKQQNFNLPHSCQSGICGQCKAEVLNGYVKQGPHAEMALSKEEQKKGKILMCCSTAESNIELKVPGYNGINTPPVKTFPARISNINRVRDVAIITLALPKAPPFAFWPGQYIDVLLKDGNSRSYSIASSPCRTDMMELHVRYREGGLFSEMLFGEKAVLKEKSIMRIRGPLGTFTLQKTNAPIILLATGTGFAPIASILQSMIINGDKRSVHFYWGARTEADLYQLQTAADLISQLPQARFTPVLSRPQNDWKGAIGYVQNLVAEDYPDLHTYEVYACGSMAMITDAKKLLKEKCKLPSEAFFSDVFLPAS